MGIAGEIISIGLAASLGLAKVWYWLSRRTAIRAAVNNSVCSKCGHRGSTWNGLTFYSGVHLNPGGEPQAIAVVCRGCQIKAEHLVFWQQHDGWLPKPGAVQIGRARVAGNSQSAEPR